MTTEEVICMARKAEFGEFVNMITNPLKRFAALVAAHEREECAKLAEKYMERWTADAIRARKEK